MKILPSFLIVLGLASHAARGTAPTTPSDHPQPEASPDMDLGAFSVSLTVQDLEASRRFYAKLGFEPAGGDAAQNWLILRNGTCTIGLFHGMFERNLMTFNPGWTELAEPREDYTDVREIQRRLKAAGLELTSEVDESGAGPGHLMLVDPDGNPILLDQHVG